MSPLQASVVAGNTEHVSKQCREGATQVQKIPLILTRPAGSNDTFKSLFSTQLAAQLDFIHSPLLEISPFEFEFEMGSDAQAIFTSSNGVRFAPDGMQRRAYCVGVRTTECAVSSGWDAVCTGQTASDLVTYLQDHPTDRALYHLCGVHVRGNVVEKLSALGFSAMRVPLYDQGLLPFTPDASRVLSSTETVIVPLFSPRAAAHFAALSPAAASPICITLSDAVRESLGHDRYFETRSAAEPTAQAVAGCIEKLVCDIRLG